MIDRWRRLWEEIGAGYRTEDFFHQLINAYTAKNRAYHNADHIAHCLHEFDQIKEKLESPTEVELAIWYHDVVYNPNAANNEEKSAECAARALKQAKAASVHIDGVKDLILATRHDQPTRFSDAAYLVDIDLSILGAPPHSYAIYEKNIRKEYKWVPGLIYRKKRKELLISFLEREKIYLTQFFATKYEQQARHNLKGAINAL